MTRYRGWFMGLLCLLVPLTAATCFELLQRKRFSSLSEQVDEAVRRFQAQAQSKAGEGTFERMDSSQPGWRGRQRTWVLQGHENPMGHRGLRLTIHLYLLQERNFLFLKPKLFVVCSETLPQDMQAVFDRSFSGLDYTHALQFTSIGGWGGG